MRRFFFLFLPIMCVFASPLFSFEESLDLSCDDESETPYGKTMTLPQLIDIALSNNPSTRAAWWRAKQAAAVVGQAESAYYPKVYAGAGARNGRDYIFLAGPQKTFTEVDAGITLSYLLFDWGERDAAVDAANAALCAANWNYDWRVQSVFFKVVERAYELWRSNEILDSQRQTLHDNALTLDAAQELYQVGVKNITDVYAAKTSFTEVKIAIIDQEAASDVASSALAASMGITPTGQPITLAKLSDPTSHLISKCELATLTETASQMRADLQAKRAEVGSFQANVIKVSRASLPKLRTEASTGWQRYIKDRASGYNYRVGLTLEIPIFDGFYYTYRNREAEAQAEAALEDLNSLQIAVALEVLVASRYVDAAQDILGLAKDRLEYALKTYEGTLDKYKVGTNSIFELIDAQQRLANARVKYSEAKFRWYLSVASLSYATGTLGSLTQLSEESCYTATK
jgi:outer membrane protein